MITTLSESRESIIEDLSDLGVRVNDILLYHPTNKQLKGMRDGLMELYRALRAYPIPKVSGLYFNPIASFSQAVREEMK